MIREFDLVGIRLIPRGPSEEFSVRHQTRRQFRDEMFRILLPPRDGGKSFSKPVRFPCQAAFPIPGKAGWRVDRKQKTDSR